MPVNFDRARTPTAGLTPVSQGSLRVLGVEMLGVKEKTFRPIAMSVLASGAIPPREALEWVCGLPNVESIVFGASSRANIRSTRQIVDELWADRG